MLFIRLVCNITVLSGYVLFSPVFSLHISEVPLKCNLSNVTTFPPYFVFLCGGFFVLFCVNILRCPLVLNQLTAAPINKIDISKLSRDRCETSFLLVASPLFITVNYHGSSIDRTRRLFWTQINLVCELFHLRINSKLICKREV